MGWGFGLSFSFFLFCFSFVDEITTILGPDRSAHVLFAFFFLIILLLFVTYSTEYFSPVNGDTLLILFVL